MIVKADPFSQALATLQADFPATFALEVEAHAFLDIGSVRGAMEIAGTMERMKIQAAALGYDVVTTRYRHMSTFEDRWVYAFTRRPDATRPQDDTLPVAILHLGEDSE